MITKTWGSVIDAKKAKNMASKSLSSLKTKYKIANTNSEINQNQKADLQYFMILSRFQLPYK